MQFANTPLTDPWHHDQWLYIRKNIGEWQGWFRQFSPMAVWQRDTPSVLTLAEDRPNEHMTLVLKRSPAGEPTQTMERDLGYPGAAPYICFFPTGAFSQGAMQRRPWSSFGAEFSLLSDHRRMRLVQLYNGTANGDHNLEYVTLIPEYRVPHWAHRPAAPETLPLEINSLLGSWHGETVYFPATMAPPQVTTSHWQAHMSGEEVVISDTLLADAPQERRFKPLDHHRWQAVDHPKQYWLLPHGVSCTVCPQLPRDQTVQLEICWYLAPHQRQRLVRHYDAQGNWLGTGLALETRNAQS